MGVWLAGEKERKDVNWQLPWGAWGSRTFSEDLRAAGSGLAPQCLHTEACGAAFEPLIQHCSSCVLCADGAVGLPLLPLPSSAQGKYFAGVAKKLAA